MEGEGGLQVDVLQVLGFLDQVFHFKLFRVFIILFLGLFLVFLRFIVIFEIYVFYYILGLETLMTFFYKKLVILVHSVIYILVIRGIPLENRIIFDKIIRLIYKRTDKLILINFGNFLRRQLWNLLINLLIPSLFPLLLLLELLL
jgi:hypothetical protein